MRYINILYVCMYVGLLIYAGRCGHCKFTL